MDGQENLKFSARQHPDNMPHERKRQRRRLRKPFKILLYFCVYIPLTAVDMIFKKIVAVKSMISYHQFQQSAKRKRRRRLSDNGFRIIWGACASVLALACLFVSIVPTTTVHAEDNPIQTASVMADLKKQDINDPKVLKTYLLSEYSAANTSSANEDDGQDVQVIVTAPEVVARPTVNQMKATVIMKKATSDVENGNASAKPQQEQTSSDKATDDSVASEDNQKEQSNTAAVTTDEPVEQKNETSSAEATDTKNTPAPTAAAQTNNSSNDETAKPEENKQEETASPDETNTVVQESSKKGEGTVADKSSESVDADALMSGRNAMNLSELDTTDTSTSSKKGNSESGEQSHLLKDSITVNNGDTFNPAGFITIVPSDNSQMLPVLTINSNVDTSKDGDYQVDYKIVKSDGSTEEKILNVTVKTPEEVIEARKKAEEERIAAEKAAQEAEEARKKAEEAAEQERQRQAQIQAQAAAQQSRQSSAAPAATGSASGQAIIATARQYLGSPYVWGGTSPSGFDCSGFSSYVFARNGISLNRTAAAQSANGYQISADQVRAGDLMIWSGHVAICEGNGYVIEAGNPSTGVYEHPINTAYGSGYFMGYYRIPGVN